MNRYNSAVLISFMCSFLSVRAWKNPYNRFKNDSLSFFFSFLFWFVKIRFLKWFSKPFLIANMRPIPYSSSSTSIPSTSAGEKVNGKENKKDENPVTTSKDENPVTTSKEGIFSSNSGVFYNWKLEPNFLSNIVWLCLGLYRRRCRVSVTWAPPP